MLLIERFLKNKKALQQHRKKVISTEEKLVPKTTKQKPMIEHANSLSMLQTLYTEMRLSYFGK